MSNLLRDCYPELFAQLHPTKNVEIGIDVNTLTRGNISQKPWWFCIVSKCGHHIWPSSVGNRVKGNGCPFCSGKIACPCNSFMTIPLLATQFDQTLNAGIDPWIIPKGSTKTLIWRCLEVKCDHHIWSSPVRRRVAGSKCSYCSSRRTCPCDSFMNMPLLAAEFYPALNPGIDPFTISRASNKILHWKCSVAKCDHHIWSSTVGARSVNHNGCPYCVGLKTCPCSSFMTIPLLAKEFDPMLNPGVDPWIISKGSHTKLNWKCSKQTCSCHIWPASVDHRVGKDNGCPFCCGRQACPHSSFMNVPLLAAEFAQYLNPEINPWTISKGSRKRLRWKCSKQTCGHHVWSAVIYNRTSSNETGCPFCSGRQTCPCTSFMNIYRLRRDYAEELNPNINPWKLPRGSDQRLNWKCADCGHVWSSVLSSRGCSGVGCPNCARHNRQSKGSLNCTLYLDCLLDTDDKPITCFYDKVLRCVCSTSSECKCNLPMIAYLRTFRYDFLFRYRGRWYIVEFDGKQHFIRCNWHKDEAHFLEKQEIDKIKNEGALLAGVTIIRISNDDEGHITRALNYFLNLDRDTPFLGVDDAKTYEHMFSKPKEESLELHFPSYTRIVAEHKGITNFPVELLPKPPITTSQISPVPKNKMSRLHVVGRSVDITPKTLVMNLPVTSIRKSSRLKIVSLQSKKSRLNIVSLQPKKSRLNIVSLQPKKSRLNIIRTQ